MSTVFLVPAITVAGEMVVMASHATKSSVLVQFAHTLSGTLVQDRTEKAVSTYENAFRRWKEWATLHEEVAMPAEPV